MKLLTPCADERIGALRWMRGTEQVSAVNYTVTVGDRNVVLRLSYQVLANKEDVAYPVELVSTGCHLGGVRWFVCLLVRGDVRCGRVRKLYLSGRHFGCRRCHGLTYTSTQQSDARVYAALRAGIGFTQFDDMAGMSVAQLGLALKVLTFAEKQIARMVKPARRSTGRDTVPRKQLPGCQEFGVRGPGGHTAHHWFWPPDNSI